MADRSKRVDLANTTITVTTGATFTVETQAGWHEPYLSLFVSTVGTGADIDVEFSANGTDFVPGKDVNGNALTNLTAVGYHQIPGKIRHIRVNSVGITAGTNLVQLIQGGT